MGFLAGLSAAGLHAFAVKLDFLVGVIAKTLRPAGSDELRGNQALVGEIIAWRNLFWGLTDAMAHNPTPWVNEAVLPNAQSGASYRVLAGDAYRRVKEIVEKIVASSLIYLPSSTNDFLNPAIQALWHARGSGDLDSMIALADRCLADYDEHGWGIRHGSIRRGCLSGAAGRVILTAATA